MPETRPQLDDDGWDDWAPPPNEPTTTGPDDDGWDSYVGPPEPRSTHPAQELYPASPRPGRVERGVRARREPRVPQEHRPSARAHWASIVLFGSVVAVALAGLSLYTALDRIDLFDPGTMADAGLLLLGTVLLAGVIGACFIAATVAILRRLSVWRASATIAVTLFAAPAVLYYAMMQGVNSIRKNAGDGALGYVPETASTLQGLAHQRDIDLGWLEIILELVAAF